MSRKSRKSRRRTPSAPQATGRQQPRKPAEQEAAPDAVPVVRAAAGDENLTETYAYVSRDLRRIALLGLLMFAIIFISPYIL
jgi:hypothetical protein